MTQDPSQPASATRADGRETALERIIAAAAELFAQRGYHGTGISELIAALGTSRGALYHHIDGKESLLFEICSRQVERMNERAADIVAKDLPADERLGLLAQELVANISAHISEWTVFFREFSALSDGPRQQIVDARDRYESHWLQVLEDGVAEGTFQRSSPLLVKGLLGMFNYTYLWFRPGGVLTPEELAEEFLAVVRSGLHVR